MGFDTERLTLRGRLAVKEADARNLELSIQGDVEAVRLLLPPFAPVVELKTQQAAVQAVELAAKHTEYLGLVAEIAAMKKALG
ncbi:MAG: hypothetical protein KJ630_08070 [Proteobacteria bacterium]|nr:hypothetical protein [Pseudomonadota bacterium]